MIEYNLEQLTQALKVATDNSTSYWIQMYFLLH